MKYFIVDAFTNQPFGGNPAGVVLLDSDTFPKEETMLKIAAELRYSETAFIREHSVQEFTIRYFTPKAEVDLCGHATIASFSMLHQKRMISGPCLCHTKAGDIQIEVGEKVMMQMAKPRIVATIEETKEIYKALGIEPPTPNIPVQIVYAGLPDLMIPLPSLDVLQSLQPDMQAVSDITRRHEAVSFHVFAFGNDSFTAHVRDFAPLYGIPEESATGTANASLTYYLQQCGCLGKEVECSFLQGEAMGRPSVVATRIQANGDIFVGGTAAIVAEGVLIGCDDGKKMALPDDHFLPLQGVPNVRDLGGYKTADGMTIKKRMLIRGASLATAEDVDLTLLADFHVAKVIDLRTDFEKKGKENKALPGTDCISIPIQPFDDGDAPEEITQNKSFDLSKLIMFAAFNEKAKVFAKKMYALLVVQPKCQKQFATFLREVINTPEGAIYFHCTQGKDRAGLAAAFLLSALGVDRETVIADFDKTNLVYAQDVQKFCSKVKLYGGGEDELAVVKSLIGANTENFINALDLINAKYGSMELYLRNVLGLTNTDFEILRKRYL